MPTLARYYAKVIAETNVDVSVTGVGVAIDGVSIADLDYAVLTGQTTQAENGYWQAHSGAPWTRATEFDTAGEMLKGTEFYIQEGSTDNAGSTWTFNTGGTITVGITALAFKRESYGPGAAISDDDTIDRDPLTNQWTMKDQFTPTGFYSRVLTDTFGRVQDATTADVETTFMEGLNVTYNSGNSITVSAGSCYIPGEAGVIEALSSTTLSSLALTANTWYHVYAYESGGTLSFEVVTQAPESTPYLGDARIKGPDGAPDDSRRYIFSIRCSSVANTMHRFFRRSADGFVKWQEPAATIRVLNGGSAVVNTTITQSAAFIPVSTRQALLRVEAIYGTTGGTVYVSASADGMSPSAGQGQIYVGATGASTRNGLIGPIVTSSTQTIEYANSVNTFDSYVDVVGFWLAR